MSAAIPGTRARRGEDGLFVGQQTLCRPASAQAVAAAARRIHHSPREYHHAEDRLDSARAASIHWHLQIKHPERSMVYRATPIGDSYAHEIQGLDLSKPLDPATLADLQELYARHGVLVIRRQAISEFEFADFCGLFGELERTVRTDWASSGRPEIGLITNLRGGDGKPLGGLADGELEWHSDQSYMQRPATGAGLHASEIANVGGTTYWANLQLAYHDLPETLKKAVDGKQAVFRYQKRLDKFPEKDRNISEEARRRTPDVVHPLVLTHPLTGKPVLYLDPSTTVGIVGMPDDEAVSLLDELNEFATRPEYVYAHKWQIGDVLLWSNGFLLHRRDPFPSTERRLLKRATMKLPPNIHVVPEGWLAADLVH
jgi:taurine dioxygenase